MIMDGYIEQNKNIYQAAGMTKGTSDARTSTGTGDEEMSGDAGAVQALPDIPYKLRKLRASDIPLFARIIGKIGIDELMACYGDEDFTDLLVKLKNRRQMLGEDETGEESEKAGNDQFILGAAVVTRIANKVIMNIESCMQEVFRLIGNLAGITAEEAANLDLDIFMAMLIKVITENNIGNFIRAARVLLK